MIAIPLRFFSDRFSSFKIEVARRPFLKNVSVMLSGSVAGQLVSLAASPLLTRLYTPQQFGILSVYAALLAVLVVVASLRYELALPLAATPEEALNLAAVCGAVLVITTSIVGIAAFSISEGLIKQLWLTPIQLVRVDAYRVLLIVGFFLLGAYYIALYLATWQGAFRAIARTRLQQGIVGPATQIGLGLAGAGAPGLVIGSILGQSASTFGLLRRAISPHRGRLPAVSWRRARALAWRYRRFPMIASWAALLDAAGGYGLLYVVVTLQYSPRVAGFLFLSERIVARPLSMLGTSILQVFVGEAGKTRLADPAKLRARFYQVIRRQFALATSWILVANAGGAILFPVIFGPQWGEAAIYLRMASLGFLAQAIVLPVFHTLQLLERQAMAAVWQFGRLMLTGAMIVIAIEGEFRASDLILCYSVAQALCCIVLLGLMALSIERIQRTAAAMHQGR